MLAYSLHELALILGQERACSDLLAVLDEYTTKDVDDVKLGVLTHLTELLSVCSSILHLFSQCVMLSDSSCGGTSRSVAIFVERFAGYRE